MYGNTRSNESSSCKELSFPFISHHRAVEKTAERELLLYCIWKYLFSFCSSDISHSVRPMDIVAFYRDCVFACSTAVNADHLGLLRHNNGYWG